MNFQRLKLVGNCARSSTALLESCDWDEEELEALMERISVLLQEMTDALGEDTVGNLTPAQQRAFLANLRIGLPNIARADQIDTIVEYIGSMTGMTVQMEVD